MNTNTRFFILMGWAVLGIALLANAASAEESTYPLESATTISNPDSAAEVRFLARPPIDFPDTTITIDHAALEIVVEPQFEDSTSHILLKVLALTRDWDPGNVSWTGPWENPGGDFDTEFYAHYAVTRANQQSIKIDMTDLCSRWADGRLPYYGFMVVLAESSLRLLTFVREGDGNGPWATLRISYTGTPGE